MRGPTTLALLVLLASTQLSAAAVSAEQGSDADRIAVQAAIQDLVNSDTSHAGRGITVSTKNVVLKEAAAKRLQDPGDAPVRVQEKAARVNDPGDAPVRQSSNAVREKAARVNDPGDAPVRQSSNAIRERAARVNDPGDAPVRQSSNAIRERAARVNDPGDAPVRQSSNSVRESGARLATLASAEDVIQPDAVPGSHFVSAPNPAASSNPIFVRKVTYDAPHAASDIPSVADAAATTVREMQQADDLAGQPWAGLGAGFNEWLDIAVLTSELGQYGNANAVGGYGYGGAAAAPVAAPKARRSMLEAGIATLAGAADLAEQPWVGVNEWLDIAVLTSELGQYGNANAVGGYGYGSAAAAPVAAPKARRSMLEAGIATLAGAADLAEQPWAGVNEWLDIAVLTSELGGQYGNANAVGGYGGAAAPGGYGAQLLEAGMRADGAVAGIYEDPEDYAPTRRLLQDISSIAGVNVGVSAQGKVAVDVAAPFTAVSVRKEVSAAAGSLSAAAAATVNVPQRKLAQTIVDVAGVHVGVTPQGDVAVAAPFTAVDVRKEAGQAAASSSSSSTRKLSQTINVAGVNVDVTAAGKVAVDVAAPFTAVSVRKEVGAASSTSSSSRSLLDDAKRIDSSVEEEEAEVVEPQAVGEPVVKAGSSATSSSSAKKTYAKKHYSGGSNTQSHDDDDDVEGDDDSHSGGYYSKGTSYKKAPSGYYSKGTKAGAQQQQKATVSKVDTAGADPKGADVRGADTRGADPAGASAAVASVASSSSSNKPVKSFHFATAEGEGSEESQNGMQGAPLSMKAAVAAAAVAAEDSKAAQAASAAAASVQTAAAAAQPSKKQGSSSSKSSSKPAAGEMDGDAPVEPRAAKPMFTKLTLTPKQIEEVQRMRAQMAATDSEEREESVLPMVAGASSVAVAKADAADLAKPLHLPATAQPAADAKDEEEDEEEDEDGASTSDADQKAPAAADSKVAAKAATPAAAAAAAATQEAETRDPFFNVVSKPKGPLAGLFGIMRPASVVGAASTPPSGSSPYSTPYSSPGHKSHKGHKGHKRSHKRKGHKSYDHEDTDLNPYLPQHASPYSSSKPDHPTAAGLSSGAAGRSSRDSLGSVSTASVASTQAASQPAKVDISSIRNAESEELNPNSPFFFSAKEAGSRLAAAESAQRPPGSSGNSSSQDTPIEIVRALARKLLWRL